MLIWTGHDWKHYCTCAVGQTKNWRWRKCSDPAAEVPEHWKYAVTSESSKASHISQLFSDDVTAKANRSLLMIGDHTEVWDWVESTVSSEKTCSWALPSEQLDSSLNSRTLCKSELRWRTADELGGRPSADLWLMYACSVCQPPPLCCHHLTCPCYHGDSYALIRSTHSIRINTHTHKKNHLVLKKINKNKCESVCVCVCVLVCLSLWGPSCRHSFCSSLSAGPSKGCLKVVCVCVCTCLSVFVWTKLWFLVLAVSWTFKGLLEGCVPAYVCVCVWVCTSSWSVCSFCSRSISSWCSRDFFSMFSCRDPTNWSINQ